MAGSPTSVLIVDDEPPICALIADELSEHGFDCRFTPDPTDAIAMLRSVPTDILIADITMPKVDGLGLLALARQEHPACKVIMITGQSSRDRLAQALTLGAYDYIEKPLDMDGLLDVVIAAAREKEGTSKLAVDAAEAIELRTRARQASLDSVRALVRAVEAKDAYTCRHSEQVAHYATNLARAMGLPEETIESIRIASLLHDIGKIGVPDDILTKPGSLTEEEFQVVRRHPALGAEIVASITMFGEEAQLVRYHQERWDGTGYPDGLMGEESPLAARIIQVADSMDAMLMERSYKKGYSVEKMLGELTRCAGTQFDPRIATVAVQWCQANPEKLILSERRPAAVADWLALS